MAVYQIDPVHSAIEFSARHLMISTVRGRFQNVSGEILFDEADPTRSSVSATADVASVATGDAQRDGHLKSPDFFDAEKFPVLSFKSKRIEKNGGRDEYKIVGDLTIRDVTREVALDATYLGQEADPWGGKRAGFSAATTVNRKDFGLQWNVALESGGVLVGDNIKINLEVEAVRQN